MRMLFVADLDYAPDQSFVGELGRTEVCRRRVLPGWIQRDRPDIVLSGHIRNAPFHAEGARAFNPGQQIGPCPAFIALDLAGMQAEWSSVKGLMTQNR